MRGTGEWGHSHLHVEIRILKIGPELWPIERLENMFKKMSNPEKARGWFRPGLRRLNFWSTRSTKTADKWLKLKIFHKARSCMLKKCRNCPNSGWNRALKSVHRNNLIRVEYLFSDCFLTVICFQSFFTFFLDFRGHVHQNLGERVSVTLFYCPMWLSEFSLPSTTFTPNTFLLIYGSLPGLACVLEDLLFCVGSFDGQGEKSHKALDIFKSWMMNSFTGKRSCPCLSCMEELPSHQSGEKQQLIRQVFCLPAISFLLWHGELSARKQVH